MKINTQNFLLALALTLALSAPAQAQAPSWWTNQCVLNTNQASDYALINQGQLKALAKTTFLEMQQLGAADSTLTDIVAGFSNTNNFAPVNIGQLKYLAKPFYDRLNALGMDDVPDAMPLGMTGAYPWSSATTTNDYALANIGQAKYVFSFDLEIDSDNDDLPDLWELAHFADLDENASGDADQDGLTNLQEYQMGLNPIVADTDGDGVSDGAEVAQGRDPHAASVSDSTGTVNLKVFTVLE